MYICMYVSVTLKNARMSHLGMQFYTTTRRCQRTRLYRGRRKEVVSARRLTTRRKRRKRERTHPLELDGDQRVG